MPQGTITVIRGGSGFGFITPDDDHTDLFFHMSALLGMRFDQLAHGQRVTFDVGVNPSARTERRAENVRLILS